ASSLASARLPPNVPAPLVCPSPPCVGCPCRLSMCVLRSRYVLACPWRRGREATTDDRVRTRGPRRRVHRAPQNHVAEPVEAISQRDGTAASSNLQAPSPLREAWPAS